MNHSMTWADFYLVCFAVGFCLSFFSFVFGGARVGRLHLPHFHGHIAGAHIPTTTMPTAHAPVAARTPVGVKATAGQAAQQGGVSPFNFVTSTAFLAWFGGTGYLLTRYSGVWVGFGLLASITSGLVGGGIVFLFLSKVLISEDENMDPADYEMVGVLGRICSWDPRGRNWRNDLHANGNAPRVRRPQRRCELPSPRGAKWWSRVTKRELRTFGCGAKCRRRVERACFRVSKSNQFFCGLSI